ncbi:hypothetical protein N9O57_01355 [bacterium]|nr:hypothetical protein [bacterium]
MFRLFLTMFFCLSLQAKTTGILPVTKYKSWENEGKGKLERIDRVEKYLEEMSVRISKIESKIDKIDENKEGIEGLRSEFKEIQSGLSNFKLK